MIEHLQSAYDLPPPLYKYLSFSQKLPDRVADLLLRDSIGFASPLSFNDPFDCFPRIDLAGRLAERGGIYARTVRRQALGRTRVERRRILADLSRGYPRGQPGMFMSREAGETAWRDTIRNMGILSLTSRQDDLLMWGHYAASHSGFCVRFDPARSPFLLAHRVHYQEERPVFRVLDPDRGGLIDRVVLRKARAWQYEAEWRVMKAGHIGLARFDTTAVTGLILGAAISQEDERHVREIVSRHRLPIELLRAKIDSDRYLVQIGSA